MVNNVKTLNQEDGVFDISIANAVSGVPTTYNSLELALSGTNIPVDGDARVTHGINGSTAPDGITDENCRLAQIAAMHAIKRPFEITDMTNEIESNI